MDLNKRATIKRLACMLCSMGTIGGYGLLVAGTGGYLLGEGRPIAAAAGAVIGTLLAVAAIKLWQSYLRDVEELCRIEEHVDGNDEI